MTYQPNDVVDAPPGPLGPTGLGERVDSMDTLRGLAVLGIFVMNIPTFALPGAAFFNPPIAGGFEGGNYLAWLGSHLFFEMKMMALFSMLFGAGVAMMADRVEASGRRAGPTHYRRMGWLLLIGLLHAYLIWFGDILVAYALVGMLVYPLRRMAPKWKVVLACLLLPITMAASGLQQAMFEMLREADDPELAKAWLEIAPMFFPTEADLLDERGKVLGGFVHRAVAFAPDVLMMQTWVFAVFMVWRVAGLMLLGMAMQQWGVLAARRSTRFYTALAAIAGGAGLALVSAGVVANHRNGFDPIAFFGMVGWYNQVGSVGVALGWMGLVMLGCRTGALGRVRRGLAAVGRMALTNYLVQSLIGAFIFYGWGLGRFDAMSRWELLVVVLGVWALQLAWSPWWLRRYRYGPMEWVWRSLTYGRASPMRKGTCGGTDRT